MNKATVRPITAILVPTDFSPASERALLYACELADGVGACLHVLYVIEDPFAGDIYSGMMVAPPEGYFEHLDHQSRARLTSLLTAEQRHRHSVVFATRMGPPATQIVNYVRDHGAIDLIVMAASGRGGVARLLLGSVTNKVVRAAPCPVLILHAHDRGQSSHETRAA